MALEPWQFKCQLKFYMNELECFYCLSSAEEYILCLVFVCSFLLRTHYLLSIMPVVRGQYL